MPVEREVLHRSPILFTPYRADGSIDADALRAFIDGAYAGAGLSHNEVDTGAVILTGAALESRNAAEIANLFAAHGGKFVCAAAGHRIEAILAAHGSGGTEIATRRQLSCSAITSQNKRRSLTRETVRNLTEVADR